MKIGVWYAVACPPLLLCLMAWDCKVSSFGVGGTNGHAIFWGEGGVDGRCVHELLNRRSNNLHGMNGLGTWISITVFVDVY